MKTLIIVLIIAAFLQTSVLPVDLVLLILICRAYIKSNKSNLYLAFGFGLFVSLLSLSTFGLESVTFLIIVQATQMLSGSRLAGNPLLIIPVSLFFLFLNQLINLPFNFQMINFVKLIIEAVLALPILYMVRLWEERFIVRKGIKLRM